MKQVLSIGIFACMVLSCNHAPADFVWSGTDGTPFEYPAWKGEKISALAQIRLHGHHRKVSLEISDLECGNYSIPGGAATANFVEYVTGDVLDTTSYSQCGTRNPGQYDSLLVADMIDNTVFKDIASGELQPLWLSIKVPSDAVPGKYTGNLKIKYAGGKLSVPFTFEVCDRTLPVVMGADVRDLGKVIQETSVRKNGQEIPLSVLMIQSYESDLKSVISGAEGNYYPVDMELDGRDVRKAMAGVRDIVGDDGRFDAGFSGSWFSNRQMINELLAVLAIALVLLYLILASQFESLIQPLVILSEIVIDIFGALAVLWICGVSINLMSMIGLVVICGIVINDSILKIDTINRLRKSGYMLRHAIMEAGQRRLKAIVMTSLTTILSVCPFLARGSMGDDLQYPMSLVIIAGMVVGTTVSLLFVPMVYYEIYRHTEKEK